MTFIFVIPCPLVVTDTSKSPTHSYHHPLPAKLEYRGHNYRVISGNLSWYDAMVTCRENHSDLASIMDAYHQAFLTVLVNRLGAPHWIGLHSEMAVSIKKSDRFVSLVCCHYYGYVAISPPLLSSSRAASVISGRTAVKQCTHTGTQRTTTKTLWLRTACMWMSMADGGGQTVRRCYQAPSVSNRIRVSSSRVRTFSGIPNGC